MSFCEVEIMSGKHTFIGLENYIKAFTIDLDFNRLLVPSTISNTFWKALPPTPAVSRIF